LASGSADQIFWSGGLWNLVEHLPAPQRFQQAGPCPLRPRAWAGGDPVAWDEFRSSSWQPVGTSAGADRTRRRSSCP